jgi:predicted small metal-binding protein
MRAIMRCDCGFEAVGDDTEALQAAARVHSRDSHGTELSDEALAGLIGRTKTKEGGK